MLYFASFPLVNIHLFLLQVETSDHARLKIRIAMNNFFEVIWFLNSLKTFSYLRANHLSESGRRLTWFGVLSGRERE